MKMRRMQDDHYSITLRVAVGVIARLLPLLTLLGVVGPGTAFDDQSTHRILTETTVPQSRLDSVLKRELGFADGAETVLASHGRRQDARSLLAIGSILEDDPACRASNHFHNPLRGFSSAQLGDLRTVVEAVCGQRLLSSAVWGTRHVSPTVHGEPTANTFDWDAARMAYLQALTAADPAAREEAFGDTFLALGHVLHLVQDLAVPAHARNDFRSHIDFCVPRLAVFTRWCENSFERFVRLHPPRVDASPAVRLEPLRGERLLRFWDLDHYDGTNPSSDLAQGLAEYTNANFASQNTIFSEELPGSDPYAFPYPRQTSTNVAALFAQSFAVVREVVSEDQRVDTALYVEKTRDGETIKHFLNAGYLTRIIADTLPSSPALRLSFQIDDVVHRDYAELLLPRAIAYGSALIDYFFRGRLDVELVAPDAADPAVVQLRGTNGSVDRLDGGTLSLYGDTVSTDAGGEGRRVPLRALDSVVLTAEPGAPVVSARFQALEEAERFVAVYEGKLGEETPAPGVPGAVIGKVFGGVRVEEVFAEGDQWKLRTPRGIFALRDPRGPLTRTLFPTLRWGDGQDILVASTPFGQNQPNRFVVYELPRRPGSVDVVSATGSSLELVPRSEAVFPFGMSLGTTVAFQQALNYQQHLVSQNVHLIATPSPGDPFTYRVTDIELGPLTVEVVNPGTHAFEDRFAIVLDDAHNDSFSVPDDRRYRWNLQEVTADATGRLVGLVQVTLNRPAAAAVRVPFIGLNAMGLREERPADVVTLTPFFPAAVNPLLWALIDIAEGKVIASTAEETIAIASEVAVEATPWDFSFGIPPTTIGVWKIEYTTAIGGVTPGDTLTTYFALPPRRIPGVVPVTIQGEVPVRTGETGLVINGWVRPDLRGALAERQLFSLQLGTTELRNDAVYYWFPTGASLEDAERRYGLTVVNQHATVLSQPARLKEARRARGTGSGDRLVFLAEEGARGLAQPAHIVVWDPADRAARVVADLPLALNTLGAVTRSAALVSSVPAAGGPRSTVVASFDAPGTVTFAGIDLRPSFALLDPTYLYGLADLRFHRLAPTLERTPLPARLVGGPGNPSADYHTIRVP